MNGFSSSNSHIVVIMILIAAIVSVMSIMDTYPEEHKSFLSASKGMMKKNNKLPSPTSTFSLETKKKNDF